MTKWPDHAKKVALFALLGKGPARRKAPILDMLLTGKAWGIFAEAFKPGNAATDDGADVLMSCLRTALGEHAVLHIGSSP